MAGLEMSRVDLECVCRSSGGPTSEEEEGRVCFSDAEEGSCNSQFYSTADGDGSNYDDYSFAGRSEEILEDKALESRRTSSASDPCDFVDLESGRKKAAARVDRDCRICHLSLVGSSPASGIAIELGCYCKDDLAAAHKHCAETWFKIKGNKTCEICNSVAHNVVGPTDPEAVQQASGNNGARTTTFSAPAETQTCLNGHRFLNFILACMVFAFVISWLFHFNIPS